MGFDVGGGSSRGRKSAVKPDINVTPLVDVVLVLLIIFMVITPLLKHSVWLNVPKKPDQNEPPPPPDARPPVVLYVKATGEATLNSEPVTKSAFPAMLRRVLAARDDKTLFVSGDDDTPYRAALEFIDAARGAGGFTVAIVTQKIDPQGQ